MGNIREVASVNSSIADALPTFIWLATLLHQTGIAKAEEAVAVSVTQHMAEGGGCLSSVASFMFGLLIGAFAMAAYFLRKPPVSITYNIIGG